MASTTQSSDSDGRNEGFTQYVRDLDPVGTPPSREVFDQAWRNLRNLVSRELKRRGLWTKPPRFVGVLGQNRWISDGQSVDALTELTADCYSFVFVDRLNALVAQAKVRANIDGLIFRNVSNFIHDRQRRHDPLGSRIYGLLRAVLTDCVAAGDLVGQHGETSVDASVVLRFPGLHPASVPEVELQVLVQRWANRLLPALITTRGRGQQALQEQLRQLILELPEEGVVAFAFRDLNRLLRDVVRSRWRSVAELDSAPDLGIEGDGELVQWVPLVPPDTSFDHRDAFDHLVNCVERRLSAAEGRPGDEPSHEIRQARSIWDLLLAWASEQESGTSPFGRRDPSVHKLARILDQPRDRIKRSMIVLRRQVTECRSDSSEQAETRQTTQAGDTSAQGGRMALDIQDALRRATGEARGRASRLVPDHHSGPEPGDVFVCRASAVHGVEWIVVDRDPHLSDHWIAVIADDNPLIGDGDIDIEDVSGAPIVPRCRWQTRIATADLEPELLSRRVDTHHLTTIRQTVDRLAAGDPDRSPLRRDGSLEPAYAEWIRDHVDPAWRTLESHLDTIPDRPTAEPPHPFGASRSTPDQQPARTIATSASTGHHWTRAMAALFACATLGLTLVNGQLRSRLDSAAVPRIAPPSVTVLLGDQMREPEPWKIGEVDREMVLDVVLRGAFDCERFDIELLADDDRILWTFRDVTFEEGRERFVLPRAFLERHPSALRFFGHCGDPAAERREIGRQKITLRWPTGADP